MSPPPPTQRTGCQDLPHSSPRSGDPVVLPNLVEDMLGTSVKESAMIVFDEQSSHVPVARQDDGVTGRVWERSVTESTTDPHHA